MEVSVQTLLMVAMLIFFIGRMAMVFKKQSRRREMFRGTRDRRGRAHGKCVIQHPNGDTYDGDFCKGMMHGKGTYYYHNGGTYEGEWRNGKMHGNGVETVPPRADFGETNPTVFDGSFYNGKREGFGKVTYANGSSYVGMWHNGVKHGRGKSHTPDGGMYDGTWMASRRHGLGFERSYTTKASDTATFPSSSKDNEQSASKAEENQANDDEGGSSSSTSPKVERRFYGEWKDGELVRTFESKAEATHELGDVYKFLLDTPKLSELVSDLPEPTSRSPGSGASSKNGAGSGKGGGSTSNGVRSRPNKKKKKDRK